MILVIEEYSESVESKAVREAWVLLEDGMNLTNMPFANLPTEKWWFLFHI